MVDEKEYKSFAQNKDTIERSGCQRLPGHAGLLWCQGLLGFGSVVRGRFGGIYGTNSCNFNVSGHFGGTHRKDVCP